MMRLLTVLGVIVSTMYEHSVVYLYAASQDV
jgi:hypothetical protein